MIPTKNEVENVAPLVARLNALDLGVSTELIFVDDSTDGTPAALHQIRARSRCQMRVVHRPPERRGNGLGGAVVEGIRLAAGKWVCVMDGDLQHPPALIADLYSRARTADVDLVVASRYAVERVATSGLNPFRRAVSALLTTAARTLFPRRLRGIHDPLSGFFVVRRDALSLERLRPKGFKILLEILVRTPRLTRDEIPFTFGVRRAGASKAGLREGALYVAQLARLRISATQIAIARFGVVGALGLVVNMALFALFVKGVDLNYLAAAALATQGSTLFNFVLSERWVFSGRDHRLRGGWRIGLFFLMNNAALVVRGPLLVVLVSGLGVNELTSNLVSLLALTVLRFSLADRLIWSPARRASRATTYAYDIHGLATVVSDVALPELEQFAVERSFGRPTIRVRIGTLSPKQSDLVKALAFLARHIRYVEGLGRFGFGVEIGVGRSVEIVASPLLKRSPHVLYTNVVEPVLRWTFVKKGYALVHGACVSWGGSAYLITARTDTGKTTTVLRALDRYRDLRFLSDDLTLVAADGRVLSYPKPLTVSRHTVAAVKTPLLSWRERATLVYQSRIHSRSGRRFAFLLARARLPTATINAVVQLLVPPPKYHVERLVPGVEKAHEATLAGLVVIQRGNDATGRLRARDALELLMENCEDAFGFPPYPAIAPFLNRASGRDLRAEERAIVARALTGVPASVLSSSRMDWSDRLAAVLGHPVLPDLAEHGIPVPSLT